MADSRPPNEPVAAPDPTGDSASPAPAPPTQTPTPSQGEGASPAEALQAAGGDGADVQPGKENELWRGRTSWKHYYGKWTLWAVLIVGGVLQTF